MDSAELTPEDVIDMPLAEFEQRFGFRPVDALEKKHFAVTGKRPDQFMRDAVEAGVAGEARLDNVVMGFALERHSASKSRMTDYEDG